MNTKLVLALSVIGIVAYGYQQNLEMSENTTSFKDTNKKSISAHRSAPASAGTSPLLKNKSKLASNTVSEITDKNYQNQEISEEDSNVRTSSTFFDYDVSYFGDTAEQDIDGTQLFLKPKEKHVAANEEQVKSFLFATARELFKFRDSIDDMHVKKSSNDDLGNTYYEAKQTYHDLPIHNTTIVVRTNKNDEVSLVTGRIIAEIELNREPSFQGTEAVLNALYSLKSPPIETPTIRKEPKLGVFVTDSDIPVLVYETPVEYYDEKMEHHIDKVYVNANTGQLVKAYSQIYSALNREIYTAENKPCLDTQTGNNASQVIPGDFRFGEAGPSSVSATGTNTTSPVGGSTQNPFPGSPFPGSPFPGSPFPSGLFADGAFPGGPFPGGPFPGGPFPGGPFPGGPFPGVPFPGGAFPGGTQATNYGAADTHEISAYENTGLSYWFYKHMYNRDSFDGKGANLRSTVHTMFVDKNGGCTGMNAFFTFQDKQLVFGEGDGSGGLSEALDAVAHELTHGVTNTTSDLPYEKESGALNEALSDMFGAATEAWVDSGGSEKGNPANGIKPVKNTWILCDTCSKGMQRYMNNPTQDGQSYDYYPDRYTGQEDSGGVHTNSGIINLAFYLLSEGGTHPNNKTTVKVTGIGFEKALQIYFDSNTKLFKSISNTSTAFTNARKLLVDAAETRHGACSDEVKAVQSSLSAVGVTGQNCDSTTDPAPEPTNPLPDNPLPGSPLPGGPLPSGPFPGGPFPGGPFPGGPFPGGPFPSGPFPGGPFPGGPSPVPSGPSPTPTGPFPGPVNIPQPIPGPFPGPVINRSLPLPVPRTTVIVRNLPRPLPGPVISRSLPRPLPGPVISRPLPRPLPGPVISRSLPRPLPGPVFNRSLPPLPNSNIFNKKSDSNSASVAVTTTKTTTRVKRKTFSKKKRRSVPKRPTRFPRASSSSTVKFPWNKARSLPAIPVKKSSSAKRKFTIAVNKSRSKAKAKALASKITKKAFSKKNLTAPKRPKRFPRASSSSTVKFPWKKARTNKFGGSSKNIAKTFNKRNSISKRKLNLAKRSTKFRPSNKRVKKASYKKRIAPSRKITRKTFERSTGIAKKRSSSRMNKSKSFRKNVIKSKRKLTTKATRFSTKKVSSRAKKPSWNKWAKYTKPKKKTNYSFKKAAKKSSRSSVKKRTSVKKKRYSYNDRFKKVKSKPRSKYKSRTKAKPRSKYKSRTKAKPRSKSRYKSKSRSKSRSRSKPRSKSRSRSKSRTRYKSKSRSRSKSRTRRRR